MTQTEELKALRQEIEELRKQLADMAIALAMRPQIYYQPYYPPAPYQPVTPLAVSPTITYCSTPSVGETPRIDINLSGAASNLLK